MVKLKKKAGVARRVRRQHTGAFKAQVAPGSALREDKTLAQLVPRVRSTRQANHRVETSIVRARSRRIRRRRSAQGGRSGAPARQDWRAHAGE